MQPLAQRAVSGQATRTNRIADDRQGIAPSGFGARQGLGRRKQVFQAFDAKHTRPAECRLERQIGAAVIVQQPQTGPDRHHRAKPRGGSGRGQEQAMVLDAADVQQDRAGIGVARKPVERRPETDVRVGAEAHNVTETHPVRTGPVDYRPAQRRRLRDQRQLPGWRRDMGQCRVQVKTRNGDAERMGAEDADPSTGNVAAQVVRRAQNDGGEAVGLGQCAHRRANCVGWHGQNSQRGVFGQPQVDVTLEPAHREVGDDLSASVRIRTENGDGDRVEQRGRIEASGGIEAWNGHLRPIMLQCSIRHLGVSSASCNPASPAVAWQANAGRGVPSSHRGRAGPSKNCVHQK